MRPFRSIVGASSFFLLSFAALAQQFTPEPRDPRSAFPELTIADFKKCQDILKAPFPLLARWNTELLSEKPDAKICAELNKASVAAIMAIPKAPKKSVQFVVKNGLEMIQKTQAQVPLNVRSDLPEVAAAKAKANNQRVVQNMRSHLRQVAIALDGVPGFELKEPRAEREGK